MSAPDYLAPELPDGLRNQRIPVVDANAENLRGMGEIIRSADDVEVEIVRWPAGGWRPVDEDSGDEGGTTEGEFHCRWEGEILYGENHAVGGQYVLGYGAEPTVATPDTDADPTRLLLWHANYHPDGGQLFMPIDREPFLVPLAPAGDDVSPNDFVCFRFDGSKGLYIHPNVWHEGVFPMRGSQRFFDRQGAVHARVSVDFAKEFGCLLEVPLDGTNHQ